MDVLVIGTGEGGTTAAQKCAKAGRNVAIVDFRPYGGTCALRGCDPKKVLIDETSDLVLGAHLLGPHAEEVINLFAVAMHTRLPARKLQKLLFAYPTSASDIVHML